MTSRKIIIDAPDFTTILAARHLDENEGGAPIGSVLDPVTRSAITHVLNYVARAHNAPETAATPTSSQAIRKKLRGWAYSAGHIESELDSVVDLMYSMIAKDVVPAVAVCELPHETIAEEEDECERQRLATSCGPPPDFCGSGGEPCARHEREESHADGEHELCGAECTEPDSPAAYALARHIADHPVSTVQAAFRYLNEPLTIELHEDPAVPPELSADATTVEVECVYDNGCGKPEGECPLTCKTVLDAVAFAARKASEEGAAERATCYRCLRDERTRGVINLSLMELYPPDHDPTCPVQLKQTLTRAIFAMKSPPPHGSSHYQTGFDVGLEVAIDAVARVFDTAPGNSYANSAHELCGDGCDVTEPLADDSTGRGGSA